MNTNLELDLRLKYSDKSLYDYHLPYYGYNYFDCLVDIGACTGQVTIPFLSRHAKSCKKVLCFEPNRKNFKFLEWKFNGMSVVKLNQIGLGDGTPLQMTLRTHVTHYCDAQQNAEQAGYSIETKRLWQMFQGVDLNQKVCTVIDTEGGERYLLEDKVSTDILKQCSHVAIEIHFPNRSKRYAHFNKLPTMRNYKYWIMTNFPDTHYVYYNGICPTSGLGIYILSKKDQPCFRMKST